MTETILSWMMENLLEILILIVSVISVIIGIKIHNKQLLDKRYDRIVEHIVSGEFKKGGLNQPLITEWQLNIGQNGKEKLSIQDFNRIWEIAYYRVHNRKPTETAEQILAEHKSNELK